MEGYASKVNIAAAELFQLYVDNKADRFFSSFNVNEVKEFLERAEDSSFGKEGRFNFDCKVCGLYSSFHVKRDRDFYKELHQLTRCQLETKTYGKAHKDKRVVNVIKTRPLDDTIVDRFQKFIEPIDKERKIIEETQDRYKKEQEEKNTEDVIEQAEKNVPEQSEVEES